MKLSSFQCHYLDIHCSEKSIIYNQGSHNNEISSSVPHFIVSTCLRHEVYSFGSLEVTGYLEHKNEASALTRLLRVLCGLESEIIGEPEILYQTERGIRHAFEKGAVSRHHLDTLLEVVASAERLREKYGLTSKENYSTIAAELISKHLQRIENPTIMVVGAGYMSRLFLDNLDLQNTRLLWVNRSLSKIQKLHEDILESCKSYELIRPEQLPEYTNEADAIFAAVSHYPHVYDISALEMKPHSLTIDISYPVVFKGSSRAALYNLENTHFSDFVSEAPPSTILASIQTDIDKEVQRLLRGYI